MQIPATVLVMNRITCKHDQPCNRFACADTNHLDVKNLDEVEYLAQQGRIGLDAVDQYIAMWNEGPHLGYIAEWRDGRIRVREAVNG